MTVNRNFVPHSGILPAMINHLKAIEEHILQLFSFFGGCICLSVCSESYGFSNIHVNNVGFLANLMRLGPHNSYEVKNLTQISMFACKNLIHYEYHIKFLE